MIKTLAAAAVLSLGLAGYAMAQETLRLPLRWRLRCTIITITITIIIITSIAACTTRRQADGSRRGRRKS